MFICGMRIELPIADCRLPIADCRLPIADCRLPIAETGDWGLNRAVAALMVSSYHAMGGDVNTFL
jgi:hypothetical protein